MSNQNIDFIILLIFLWDMNNEYNIKIIFYSYSYLNKIK